MYSQLYTCLRGDFYYLTDRNLQIALVTARPAELDCRMPTQLFFYSSIMCAILYYSLSPAFSKFFRGEGAGDADGAKMHIDAIVAAILIRT